MSGIILKRNTQAKKQDKILAELKLVKEQLQNVYMRFEQTSDSDLIEATIYEMQALKAKYRYLVRSAKLLEQTPDNVDFL